MTTLLFDQDYADTMRYNEAEQKGIVKGREEGIAIGEQRGIGIGRAEGIAEERKEIARNLLNDGIPAEVVAKNTGLTVAQVKALGKKKASSRRTRQKKTA